jgi:hypothetical protein
MSHLAAATLSPLPAVIKRHKFRTILSVTIASLLARRTCDSLSPTQLREPIPPRPGNLIVVVGKTNCRWEES